MALFISIFSITFILGVCFASGEIYVTDEDFEITIATYRALPAKFGQSLPEEGLKGRVVQSLPIDGCRPIAPPPNDPHGNDPATRNWVAVISRGGGCNFQDKIRYATKANWTAAIVYNRKNRNDLVPMAGNDDDAIPSVFMGYDDAQNLLSKYSYAPANEKDLRIVLTDDHPFDINQYLLPFAIVVGICFVIMLVIVVYKCIQDYRRHRRHRLPKSALKKLPIHKFSEGDPFETCVICLDDFQDGDKLRVLPCDHGYHAKCIDPWLVKTKRICPQCRKKVFESNDRGAGLISASDRNSDSDSENDAPSQRQVSSPTNSEDANPTNQTQEGASSNAPLLGRRRREYRFFRRGPSGGTLGQRSRRAAGGGTFTSQSSVHAPPRNTTINSEGDQQIAGPSGTARNNLSAVEKLQRAFAKESRPLRRGRDNGYRNFQNDSSSDNEYRSTELSDESSDEERPVAMHQQRRPDEELTHAQVCVEADVTANSSARQIGSKGKNSARNVSAEVHVIPFDDKNVEVYEAQSNNVLKTDQSDDGDISQRSQNNELSETSQNSHIVEIRPDSPADNNYRNENPGGSVEHA